MKQKNPAPLSSYRSAVIQICQSADRGAGITFLKAPAKGSPAWYHSTSCCACTLRHITVPLFLPAHPASYNGHIPSRITAGPGNRLLKRAVPFCSTGYSKASSHTLPSAFHHPAALCMVQRHATTPLHGIWSCLQIYHIFRRLSTCFSCSASCLSDKIGPHRRLLFRKPVGFFPQSDALHQKRHIPGQCPHRLQPFRVLQCLPGSPSMNAVPVLP